MSDFWHNFFVVLGRAVWETVVLFLVVGGSLVLLVGSGILLVWLLGAYLGAASWVFLWLVAGAAVSAAGSS